MGYNVTLCGDPVMNVVNTQVHKRQKRFEGESLLTVRSPGHPTAGIDSVTERELDNSRFSRYCFTDEAGSVRSCLYNHDVTKRQ